MAKMMTDKHTASPQRIREAAADVRGNLRYKQNRERMSAEMQAAGGYPRAVDEIESFLRKKGAG
jgi:UDP:flavonoid glycosyltransferase YjiC (YdhE family)